MEEEIKETFIAQIQKEREALDNAIKESQTKIEELRELRAVEILSGKSDAGKQQKEKPVEKSNADYAKDALKGIV